MRRSVAKRRFGVKKSDLLDWKTVKRRLVKRMADVKDVKPVDKINAKQIDRFMDLAGDILNAGRYAAEEIVEVGGYKEAKEILIDTKNRVNDELIKAIDVVDRAKGD